MIQVLHVGEVCAWLVDLDAGVEAGIAAGIVPEQLGDGARERAAALADPARARRFLGARAALLSLAARWLGRDVATLCLAFVCPRCGRGAHGAPFVLERAASHLTSLGAVPDVAPSGDLPGVVLARASLSRAGRWAALALSRPEQAPGIDLADGADPAFDPALPGCVGTAEEWVRTEASGKALGLGLGRWPEPPGAETPRRGGASARWRRGRAEPARAPRRVAEGSAGEGRLVFALYQANAVSEHIFVNEKIVANPNKKGVWHLP